MRFTVSPAEDGRAFLVDNETGAKWPCNNTAIAEAGAAMANEDPTALRRMNLTNTTT